MSSHPVLALLRGFLGADQGDVVAIEGLVVVQIADRTFGVEIARGAGQTRAPFYARAHPPPERASHQGFWPGAPFRTAQPAEERLEVSRHGIRLSPDPKDIGLPRTVPTAISFSEHLGARNRSAEICPSQHARIEQLLEYSIQYGSK
jgi:hypothetical protein